MNGFPALSLGACWLCVVALVCAGSVPVDVQQLIRTGQTVVPVYEGYQRNADGSFDLLFAYFNRNWAEEIDVPVGPDNHLEPGGPDRGQPAHFYPRRNRFVFRVRVPADFGKPGSAGTRRRPAGSAAAWQGPPASRASASRVRTSAPHAVARTCR